MYKYKTTVYSLSKKSEQPIETKTYNRRSCTLYEEITETNLF